MVLKEICDDVDLYGKHFQKNIVTVRYNGLIVGRRTLELLLELLQLEENFFGFIRHKWEGRGIIDLIEEILKIL